MMKYLHSAHDVSIHLHKTHGVRISDWIIRKVLKERFGLRYKLGKLRPANYDKSKTLLIKGLFCIKQSKVINHYEVLENIDEAMFYRSTRLLIVGLLKEKSQK